MRKPQNKTKLYILIALATAVAAAAVAAFFIFAYPYIKKLSSDSVFLGKMQGAVDSLGVLGFIGMLLIQFLQVLIAVIPGEVIEVLFGFIYGPWLGLLLCLVGSSAASALIYYLVNRFGSRFIDKFYDSKKFERLKFLQNPSSRDTMIFVLFLIPGTPKDVLTYFAPFTKIPLLRFLLISGIARIPSVLTSTIAGAHIYDGNIKVTIIIFIITGIIGLCGIYLGNRIIDSHNKNNPKNESSENDKQ